MATLIAFGPVRVMAMMGIAYLATALIGCTGGAAHGQQAGPEIGQAPATSPQSAEDVLVTSFDNPLELSGISGEYPASRDGAGFAAELDHNLCQASGSGVLLSPTWQDGLENTLGQAAFCIYQLRLDPADSTAGLALTWNGASPATGGCWIGLSDWDRDTWRWTVLPANNTVLISDPANVGTAAGNCLAAVVVLADELFTLASIGFGGNEHGGFVLVDTGQSDCYNNTGQVINPAPGSDYYGQDAQYDSPEPSYTDNGDGTVTDNVTGLMWAKTPNGFEKTTFSEAFTVADGLVLGGFDDWRVPTIKELYSLIDFDGMTGMTALQSIPYIRTQYFDFEYGDEAAGERFIDAQYWSSTEYASTTMAFGSATTFGVNFADGRIKGYGRENPQGGEMKQFLRCVRGAPYGVNDFSDNGDGTISDNATGLMWMQADSGSLGAGLSGDGLMNWREALKWAEELEYAGYGDWRLPNAKELQSIVDYTRSPDTTASAAIDPLFNCTSYVDGNGLANYRYYWTGTTHLDGPPDLSGNYACYVSFGEALGYMESPPGSGNYQLLDVHGAGAQRSDPKDGDPADYPLGHGPQGDVIGIYNMVRCVRDM